MSDITLKMYVDEATMESFIDMRNVQPSKDRMHYFDTVLEGSIETNATLLQKLYNDIISKSNIDYGRIPDSQGNLLKYVEYPMMSQSMDKLNKLYEGLKSDELVLMNKLHDIIISCKKDYEFGYKFNVEIVKIAYCTAVMTLYELINICILAYTKQLRSDNYIEFSFKKVKKKDLIVLRGAKSLIKSYESGQWTKMMNEFRKDPSLIGVGNITPATEGIGDVIKGTANALASKTLGDRVAQMGNVISAVPNAVKIPAAVIIGMIVILMAIRSLIYLFYSGSNWIKESAKNQKKFIDAAITEEKENGTNPNVIERHNRMSQALSNLATFIEVRVLKTNTEATKALDETNKENYSVSDIKSATSFGGNIEF